MSRPANDSWRFDKPHKKSHGTGLQMETLESLILLSGSCYAAPVEMIVDSAPFCPTGDEATVTTVDNDASSTDPIVLEGDACPDPSTGDDFDSILKWNDVMLQANANDYLLDKADQPGPILTARAFAIVSAAKYDAYNSIEKIGEQYLTTAEFTTGANADAAVSQAAFETLVELFPSQEGFFESKLHESLSRIEDGASKDLGRTIGAQVAEAILDVRADDLYSEFLAGQYLPSGAPGFHDVDPLRTYPKTSAAE